MRRIPALTRLSPLGFLLFLSVAWCLWPATAQEPPPVEPLVEALPAPEAPDAVSLTDGSEPAVSQPDLFEEAPLVEYAIQVRLDPKQMRLQATERIRYRNDSPDPIPDLQFHLYLNSFKNDRSTFMREGGRTLRDDEMPAEGWGWIDVHELRVDGLDRLHALEHIQPDGTDPEDQTVARVPLLEPLAPGATVEVDLTFEAQLPKVFARTGYKGEYVLAGQWFPKLGVWEAVGDRGAATAGWNCHQFHATSEFYSDFGSYAVQITVPNTYVVGATGVETARTGAGQETTYTFEQDRVVDFAWTASPRFLREERVFHMADWVSETELQEVMALHGLSHAEASLPDTTMILLLQPEHAGQADRHFEALANAIKHFGLWYGPYPYPTITVVDPAWGAEGSGGMEYPTFITAGTEWVVPADDTAGGMIDGGGPEMVTIHEFGHQYWQSMVASNEFEESWLDEGFNTYSTGRIMDRVYGPTPQYARINEWPIPLDRWMGLTPASQRHWGRLGIILDRGRDRLVRRSWEFLSAESYVFNSYVKTQAVMQQLEIELGSDVMARVMRTYFQRWRFGHPTTPDFIAVAEEVSGRDLGAFFDDFVYGAGTLDYAVTEATSERIGFEAGVFDTADGRTTVTVAKADEDWLAAEEADAPGRFRSTVVVMNRGAVSRPVDIAVTFKDGETIREHWDGAYRWVRYDYERDAPLARVEVDPDERLIVDLNRTNNSFVAEPERRADARWSLKLLLVVQHLLCSLGGTAG